MLYTLSCIFIIAVLGCGSYYAAYQWINLRHNRDVLSDEHKRAVAYIEELEARIAMLEAERSLHEFKTRPQEETTGWEAFKVR